MKNCVHFLVGILLISLICSTSYSQNYLSKTEMLKIGGSSCGIAVLGYLSENSISESRNSLINGPILFDKYFQEKFNQNLSSPNNHTNFLDNNSGAVFVPILGMTFLTAIDYSHYSVDRKKQLFQDCYLYTSGLITTAGITGLFKGLVARERPYYHDQKNNGIVFDDDYKLSFFSGHTSLAFYSMHFLNKRLSVIMNEKDISAHWRYVKSLTCYGLAGYVGYSRLYVSKHYATDVLVGAGVGMLVSELFFRFGEKKGSNISLSSSTSQLRISYRF